jgi:arabinosaccharide transport system substrate-binding protein
MGGMMTDNHTNPECARRLSRRRFIGGMVALPVAASVGSGLLSACDGGGTTGTTAGGNTLEFWSFDELRLIFVKKTLQSDAWKSAHPDVKVNFRIFPHPQMHDKLLSSLVAGQGAPDIADVEVSQFGKFLRGDRIPFVSVNDRIGDQIDDLHKPAATDPWSWEEEIYGVGNELNTVTLAYRTDVMQDAGVKTPFETWDEVIAAGKKASRGDTKMFAIHDIHYADWFMMAQHAGTTLFDENGEYVGDNPEGVAAMEFNHDLVYDHAIAGIAPADATNDWFGPAYWAAFKANRFVATWGPPWHLAGLPQFVKNQSGKWTAQPLPEGLGEGRPTANFGGTGQCITEQSANPDLAWELIEACNLTVEGVIEDFKARTIYPAYRPAYDAPELHQPFGYFSNIKIGEIYESVAAELPPFNQSPIWFEGMEALIRTVVTPVMQDRADAKTALTDLRTEVENLAAQQE